MSKSLNNKVKLNDVVSVKDFGAVGDGTTDDSAALNAAITYAKTYGMILRVPSGTYKCKNLQVGGGTKQWSMIGDGKYQTIFKHSDGAGTLIQGNASSVGYTLQGFTVNAQFSVYASATARNCIAVVDTSNVTLKDLFLTDFKFNAALIYSTNAANKFNNCKIIDCDLDGLNAGCNGFLFAEMDFCHYINCSAKGVVFNVDGPGVGIQFKNNCTYGSAVDCYAEACAVGLGLAGDTLGVIQGAAYNTVSNFRSFNCTQGIRFGSGAQYNAITNAVINHNNLNTSDPIDIQENAAYNTISNAVVLNIGASRRAVYFRTDAHDNSVNFSHVGNMNTSAIIAYFDSTSLRNSVTLNRQSNPVVKSTGIQGMATFASGTADGNSFVYQNYVPTEFKTIATGVVTITNAATQLLLVDTEATAATDDLDTIGWYGQLGSLLIVQTINDARDVVLKNGTGNILLTGGADVTLPNRRSYVALSYNGYSSKWVENYRAINP